MKRNRIYFLKLRKIPVIVSWRHSDIKWLYWPIEGVDDLPIAKAQLWTHPLARTRISRVFLDTQVFSCRFPPWFYIMLSLRLPPHKEAKIDKLEFDHLETRHDRAVPRWLGSTSVYTIADMDAQPFVNYDRHLRLNQVAGPMGSKPSSPRNLRSSPR
jgi:hypothetical protein